MNCTSEATGERLVPNGWAPAAYSQFTVIGLYNGGGLFIATDSAFDWTATTFDADFGASPGEAQLIADAGAPLPWGHDTSADTISVLESNLSFMPSVTLGTSPVLGSSNVWNFTTGGQNQAAPACSPSVSPPSHGDCAATVPAHRRLADRNPLQSLS